MCTRVYTGDSAIFSIALILSESCIDPMFLNQLKWVDLSWCDLDQHELSQNIFYSNLESICCDSNLQNFCAQHFQLRNYFCDHYFENVVVSKFFH